MCKLLLIGIRAPHKLDSHDYIYGKDKFYMNDENEKCNYCLLSKWITFSRRILNVHIPSKQEEEWLSFYLITLVSRGKISDTALRDLCSHTAYTK